MTSHQQHSLFSQAVNSVNSKSRPATVPPYKTQFQSSPTPPLQPPPYAPTPPPPPPTSYAPPPPQPPSFTPVTLKPTTKVNAKKNQGCTHKRNNIIFLLLCLVREGNLVIEY